MSVTVEVVIVGGGPVGSLIAYQLARFGCQPYLIEQEDKRELPCYGRATTLWPRSIELLDQIDLAECLIQKGVATRHGLHFQDGKRIKGGLVYGSRMDKLGDTFFQFALHLRQRLTEQEFTEALKEYNFEHHVKTKLEGYTVDASNEEYPITVQVRDLVKDEVYDVQTKYIIGADGGHSQVRKLSAIPFEGASTTHRWIRMDAHVKTNMPNPRCLNSIDSSTHGQILWCPNDNGLTRIGYVFSKDLLDRYGGEDKITKDDVIREAKEAVRPFTLDVLDVDWWTIYGIGQRIADTFSAHRSRVFLAGDACHTHSSGSAQGLNTGIHDAINISWKLALTLRGLAKDVLIDSYDKERRPVVQQVIDNDRTISMLISGQYPPRFAGRKDNTWDLLTEWFEDVNMQSFTLGLGISYPVSVVNREPQGLSRATVNPGERGPDVYLTKIGTGDPVRLQVVLKNEAKFSIVVFAGYPVHTRLSLANFEASLKAFKARFPNHKAIFHWTTIPAVSGNGGQEVLGTTPIGKVYLDERVKAHEMYGVDPMHGAVVIFRPDGWIGAVFGLEEASTGALTAYFEDLLI
ncbi:FAD binding domain-containing protein [Mucidula mucida]|nr:FAD binding domain-containing protein [Mucidula mucida]